MLIDPKLLVVHWFLQWLGLASAIVGVIFVNPDPSPKKAVAETVPVKVGEARGAYGVGHEPQIGLANIQAPAPMSKLRGLVAILLTHQRERSLLNAIAL